VGTFDAGVFPRQWALSPNGKWLYLTEFLSDTLAIFPVKSLVHQVQ
jgi:6-phosphogluconolactonase (cycloisomerase 2 family)